MPTICSACGGTSGRCAIPLTGEKPSTCLVGQTTFVSNFHPDSIESAKTADQYIKGVPKATSKFTSEQLVKMGYVGLYETWK